MKGCCLTASRTMTLAFKGTAASWRA
jgi:hypothetical protein